MTKFIGQWVIRVLFFSLSLLVTLLFTYIVRDTSKLFDINVILDHFSMMQLFGVLMIVKYILSAGITTKDFQEVWTGTELSFYKDCLNLTKLTVIKCITMLLFWVSCYFSYWLFF